jgi:hypothetical protein
MKPAPALSNPALRHQHSDGRSRLRLLPFAALAATVLAILPFHAEEEPPLSDEFAYDRTESVLIIHLNGPQGTSLGTPTATLPVDVFVERHSWEIWRRPSGIAEEARNPQTQPASNVQLTFSATVGSPGSASATTNWEGRASTSFTAAGILGSPQLHASAGGNSASLSFSLPGETWTCQQTEATLSASLEAPSGDTEIPQGENRPFLLTIRYNTWDVETSNFGNSRTVNHTSSPASGAAVSWTTLSGDGYPTGGLMADLNGQVSGNLVMGSANTVVRADVSYATGQATSAERLFTVQTPPPVGTTWSYHRSETIPAFAMIAPEGSATVPQGETRTIIGELRYDVWDIYTNGIGGEDRRYNYSYPAANLPVSVTAEQGNGFPSFANVYPDWQGRFTIGYTMGSIPSRLRFEAGSGTQAYGYVDLSPSNSTGSGANWQFAGNDWTYRIHGPFLDGPGQDLAPGTNRAVTVNVTLDSWEIWNDGQGNTETRNEQSVPAGAVSVDFSVADGDATLGGFSAQTTSTTSLGDASIVVTSGTSPSQIVATVSGTGISTSTTLVPVSQTPVNWQFLRPDGYFTLEGPSATANSGTSQTIAVNVIRHSWEVWTDGQNNFENRNPASGPAVGTDVEFQITQGDASLNGSAARSVSTDSQGNASVIVTPGLHPSVLSATIAGTDVTSVLGISPASSTQQTWQFSHHDGRFAIRGPVLDGPTYDLAPGAARSVSVNVSWDSWEVWVDGQGGEEHRNRASSATASIPVSFVVSQGDGLVNGATDLTVSTDGFGNASVNFMMGARDSRVVASAYGVPSSVSVDFTPPPAPQPIWTRLNTEGTVTLSISPVAEDAVVAPGTPLPLKISAYSRTWEFWQSSTGATEERNRREGPAMGVEIGISKSGPGELAVVTATTNADGEAFATLTPTDEPVTVLANLPFYGATATAERVFTPQAWVYQSTQRELLVSFENPWPGGLDVLVQQRSHETWTHPDSPTPQIRAVSVGAANNAQVTFSTASGSAVFPAGPHATGTNGRVQVEYTAGSSVNFVANVTFAGMTGQAQLVAPAFGSIGGTVGPVPAAFTNQGPSIPLSFSSSAPLPQGTEGKFKIDESSNPINSTGGGDGAQFYISTETNGVEHWSEGRSLTVRHSSATEDYIEGGTSTEFYYTYEYVGEGLGDWEPDPNLNEYVHVGVGMGSYNQIQHTRYKETGGSWVPGSPEETIKGRFVIRWSYGAPRDMKFRVIQIDTNDDGTTTETEIAPILVNSGATEVSGPWYDPPTDGSMNGSSLN